jgi:hypothetical protein
MACTGRFGAGCGNTNTGSETHIQEVSLKYTNNSAEYHTLANCLVTRDLWMALAHCIVLAKPGSDKLMRLNVMYMDLPPGDKLRCQAEIRKCQAARRGEIEAIIAE